MGEQTISSNNNNNSLSTTPLKQSLSRTQKIPKTESKQNSVIFSPKKIKNDFLENSTFLNNSENFFQQNNFENDKNDYGLAQIHSPSSVILGFTKNFFKYVFMFSNRLNIYVETIIDLFLAIIDLALCSYKFKSH